jgi:hypothetical protein
VAEVAVGGRRSAVALSMPRRVSPAPWVGGGVSLGVWVGGFGRGE